MSSQNCLTMNDIVLPPYWWTIIPVILALLFKLLVVFLCGKLNTASSDAPSSSYTLKTKLVVNEKNSPLAGYVSTSNGEIDGPYIPVECSLALPKRF